PYLDAAGDPHGIEHEARGAHHEIVFDMQRVFYADLGAARASESDIDGVGERDGLEDGAQLVVAVGPFAEDPQIEIDFGQCPNADHLSYWISENTSLPSSLLRPLRNVNSTTNP